METGASRQRYGAKRLLALATHITSTARAGSRRTTSPSGWKLRVDDGSGAVQVFFPASGGNAGLDRIRAGSEVAVTGFSGQYDRTYEVIPASRADLSVDGTR
jgi:hypothetical protein